MVIVALVPELNEVPPRLMVPIAPVPATVRVSASDFFVAEVAVHESAM